MTGPRPHPPEPSDAAESGQTPGGHVGAPVPTDEGYERDLATVDGGQERVGEKTLRPQADLERSVLSETAEVLHALDATSVIMDKPNLVGADAVAAPGPGGGPMVDCGNRFTQQGKWRKNEHPRYKTKGVLQVV